MSCNAGSETEIVFTPLSLVSDLHKALPCRFVYDKPKPQAVRGGAGKERLRAEKAEGVSSNFVSLRRVSDVRCNPDLRKASLVVVYPLLLFFTVRNAWSSAGLPQAVSPSIRLSMQQSTQNE